MKKWLILILTISIFSIPGIAVSESIPQWIKNLANWWSTDQITDQEYLDSINYLIENKIINPNLDTNEKFVKIEGQLFDIFYERDSLENPFGLTGYVRLNTILYFQLNDEKSKIYDLIKSDGKTAVVVPMYTFSAYSKNGFYDYFTEKCDEVCLTVPYREDLVANYESSLNGATILKLLGYDLITDIEVDKNPNILKKYEKIVLLHNEYVTKKMFDSIINHKKVIYLYPNALYAEVESNHDEKTISLIRGHGYPEKSIDNGFNWKYDNTRPDEFDIFCDDWKFKTIDNGIMLNCYPEHVIFKNLELLKEIRNY